MNDHKDFKRLKSSPHNQGLLANIKMQGDVCIKDLISAIPPKN